MPVVNVWKPYLAVDGIEATSAAPPPKPLAPPLLVGSPPFRT